MKIAVNTRLLIKDKLDGIGWFTCESLKRITRAHPEHTFYFIFDRPYDPSFLFSPNVVPVVLHPQARHPVLYMIWFDVSIPILLKRIKPDLFLTTDGFMSLSTRVPSVAVIHDLNFEHYPKDLPHLVSWYYRYFFPRFARKAIRIATVSNYSKNDICKRYGISPDKIDVVFNGAHTFYRPLPEKQQAFIRQKYTGNVPYFIFIGALHPRKNLVTLFKAFDLFCAMQTTPCKLVIVGSKMWWTSAMRHAYESMSCRDDVIFTGRLPNEELHHVLASALALVYVSYFEGFGIPIVEAFACQTPVIASNVTSLPEVSGDSALLVDPFSVEQVAQAMHEIFHDPELRKSLKTRGYEQGRKFSWDKTASLLWTTIEKSYQTLKSRT